MATIAYTQPVGITNSVDKYVVWNPLTAADKIGDAIDITGYNSVTVSVYGIFGGCVWTLATSMDASPTGSGDQAYSTRIWYNPSSSATEQKPILVDDIASTTAPEERVFTLDSVARFLKPAILASPAPPAQTILLVTAMLRRV